jgi:hypothetical protein
VGEAPTAYRPGRQLGGVEVVIDKDHASALFAADVLILATDAPAALVGFGTANPQIIRHANPEALLIDMSRKPIAPYVFICTPLIARVTRPYRRLAAHGRPRRRGAVDWRYLASNAGGDDVGNVPVEGDASAHGGAWVGVRGGFLPLRVSWSQA